MKWSNSLILFCAVTVVVTVLDVTVVNAFPSSAGSCISGAAAVSGSHKTNAVRFEGTLADIGVEVSISNVTLTPDTLVVETGTHTIEVKSPLHDYAGILIRIESADGTMDVSSSIIPGTNTKAAMTCTAPVGGVDHEDPTPKRISTASIRIDASSEIYLDITVVGMNNDTASVFGYTRYQVKFTDQTTSDSVSTSDSPSDVSSDVPSDVPSDSPSSAPITTSTRKRQRHLTEKDRMLSRLNLREYLKLVLANLGENTTSVSDLPSISPTFIASDVPSIFPSDAPSLSPSALPSDIPSSFPSDVPSSLPSDIPSSLPSDIPSVAPAVMLNKEENIGKMEKQNRRRVEEKKGRPTRKVQSDVPSDVPSDAPSDVPSDATSNLASDSSSTSPSTSPTKTKKTMKERN